MFGSSLQLQLACLATLMTATVVVRGALTDGADILGPLPGKTGPAAVWLLVPGAEITQAAYLPLVEAVQRECPLPLWAAVLGSLPLAPTTLPPELGPSIDSALQALQSKGLDLSAARLFYGGHSLGSVFIQDHLAAHLGPDGPLHGKVNVTGQVLMGGFIQRKYLYPRWSYPVSTLTVGGELDGLARITRLAEAFYHSRGRFGDFPVEVVPGMTHMQFASGEPPALVRLRDLKPEIPNEVAQVAVARLVSGYFQRLTIDGGVGVAAGSWQEASAATEQMLQPIIDAYDLEGSRDFNAPDQIGGPGAKNCVKGGCPSKSKWAPEAQRIISEVEGWTLQVDNQYVDCKSTPLTGEEFHLPVIKSDNQTNTISITTYSQAYWDDARPSWFGWREIFDKFDTGFVATSAEELGTKLASRQCTLIQGAGQADTPFNVDDPDFCAQTNAKAYAWARDHAGEATRLRFEESGQKYEFGQDISKSGGPLFLDARLQFDEITKPGGEKVVQVSAPMQKTEIDYWKRHFGPIPRPASIPDPGCFHYCKLLSPARAIEWIYVDSLRAKLGLSANSSLPLASSLAPATVVV
mmetsp:Transcript_129350/g.322460  ORF Transcript_129350/g.322460 Transcript_129350/m.322460 type:complete len:579 (-) Transcript_129350:79-1815(-)